MNIILKILGFFVIVLLKFSCTTSDRNNTVVTFDFQCYENRKFKDFCPEKDDNCDLVFKLCVSASDQKPIDLTCDIYTSYYYVKNTYGKCIRGMHDSRDELGVPRVFNTTWRNLFIFLQISSKENGEGMLSSQIEINPSFNRTSYEMSQIRQTNVKIKVGLKFDCLPTFYGSKCEKHCRNVSSHFWCTETGSRYCVNGYEGEYCNKRNCTSNSENNCRNNSKVERKIPCDPDISGCDGRSCILDLIILNYTCDDQHPPSKMEIYQAMTLPACVLGGIIVLLLIIIFILAVYKRNRPTPQQQPPRRQWLLPQRPVINSCIDDFLPPEVDYTPSNSAYADMGCAEIS